MDPHGKNDSKICNHTAAETLVRKMHPSDLLRAVSVEKSNAEGESDRIFRQGRAEEARGDSGEKLRREMRTSLSASLYPSARSIYKPMFGRAVEILHGANQAPMSFSLSISFFFLKYLKIQ